MSSELEGRSEVGVVLQNAPQLRKAYGPILGAILTWKALSASRPRGFGFGLLLSIYAAAAGAFWHRYGW